MNTHQNTALNLAKLKNACSFCCKWLIFKISNDKLEQLTKNQDTRFGKDFTDCENDFLKGLLFYKTRMEDSSLEQTPEEQELEDFLNTHHILPKDNTLENLSAILADDDKGRVLIAKINKLFNDQLNIEKALLTCINGPNEKTTDAVFMAISGNNPLERAISFLSIVRRNKVMPFYLKVDENANAIAITFEEEKLNDLNDSEIRRYALDLIQKAKKYELIDRGADVKILCSDIRLMAYLFMFLQTSFLTTPHIYLNDKNCEYLDFQALNYLIEQLRDAELQRIAMLYGSDFLIYGDPAYNFYQNLYNNPQQNIGQFNIDEILDELSIPNSLPQDKIIDIIRNNQDFESILKKLQINSFIHYLTGENLSSLINCSLQELISNINNLLQKSEKEFSEKSFEQNLKQILEKYKIEHIPLDQLMLISAGKGNVQKYLADLKNVADTGTVDKYFSDLTNHMKILSDSEKSDTAATLSHAQINESHNAFNESGNIRNASANHQKGIELQQKIR